MTGRTIACIEIGGSGAQTVIFDGGDACSILEGVAPAARAAELLLLAVPGIIDGDRVLAASNLGWYDVDPAAELGLGRGADLLLNDAEAAALGEAALRGIRSLTFVGLGTGVGGAVVADGRVVLSNLFGHEPGFSSSSCICGRTGCLETVAAGWALPDPLEPDHPALIADALCEALRPHPVAAMGPLVVTGGLARRYPSILDELACRLPAVSVEATAAPAEAKSGAAWGLLHVLPDMDPVRP